MRLGPGAAGLRVLVPRDARSDARSSRGAVVVVSRRPAGVKRTGRVGLWVLRAVAVFAAALAVGAAALSAPIVLAGGSASGAAARERPDVFLTRVLLYQSLGQYDRAYDLLAPGQQRLVTRSNFDQCYRKTLPPYHLIGTRRLDQYAEPIHTLGVPQKRATAVKLRVMFFDASEGNVGSVTVTWHAVWLGSHWAWMLTSSATRAMHSGDCPS